MKVTFWGTRGSIAAPGPETVRYGGNTSCVQIEGPDDSLLILDGGSGIRKLGGTLVGRPRRLDVLLTHLHLDHILGLGFFAPLRFAPFEVHLWGPAGTSKSLARRLGRYLSPPIFPVRIRDLPCKLQLHEVSRGSFDIGPFRIDASYVCHPGPTLGYRIEHDGRAVTYLSDHEPALGVRSFPGPERWTSGYSLAEGADLLIHDGQYTEEEYAERVGWGHSSIDQAFAFARLVGTDHLVPFHHEPARSDDALEAVVDGARERLRPSFTVTPAAEGMVLEVGAASRAAAR